MARKKTKKKNDPGALPDQEQRDQILHALNRNLLVEAAAGTGKTTSMVARMVALLRKGKCSIRSLVAVTFTRKAAAELRARFQVALETGVREAKGVERKRLEEALARIEQCFTGTIHAFCARLLRERPVEAGIDLAFSELEETEDARLRGEAWDAFTARLMVEDDGDVLESLEALGLELPDLKSAFLEFCTYPDVEAWPAGPKNPDLPDPAPAKKALEAFVARMRALSKTLPEDEKEEHLFNEYRRLPRVVRHFDLDSPPQLMEALRLFDRKPPSVSRETLKTWRKEAKKEQTKWKEFREVHASPLLTAWRKARYRPILEVFHRARKVYDRLRADRGALNFQDLLMKAAALLRENPHVRRYFRGRFTHLLIDEFQDTDPIQAEVMLLLTATDEKEKAWKKCKPAPGSLFVVGDPKQSIYRFRRADIVTYNEVKRIIEKTGGLVLSLWANFRSGREVIDWVNGHFSPLFPEEATEASPVYVPLQRARAEGKKGALRGLRVLQVPAGNSATNPEACAFDADCIARFIRRALDEKQTLPRTLQERERGLPPHALASDFMIVTRNKGNLGVFARALKEYGIPHRVTGGTALNELPELAHLHRALEAVTTPDNPVALVAALRSELFGISDADLYAFKKAGGTFNYNTVPPAGMKKTTADAFRDAFSRLKEYSLWLSKLPPLPAIERIVADLGLFVLAGAREGGEVEAGGFAKALEILRHAQGSMWTTAQIVEYMGQLVDQEEPYDAIGILSEDEPAVRVLNLHKVKGLEAPVVFLADPAGAFTHPVTLHVDRTKGRVVGHMAVHGERWGVQRAPLRALPPDWEAMEAREKAFAQAEELRLHYVAATRAGSMLVVTQRESRNHFNPWKSFAPSLEPVEFLPDPGDRFAPEKEEVLLDLGEIRRAEEEIARRLEAVRCKTHDVLAAKTYALSAGGGPPPAWESISFADAADMEGRLPPEGEHGVEWGSTVHQVLEVALKAPEADLHRGAHDALEEYGLHADLAESVVAVVTSVKDSPIWARAMRSETKFAEIPFQVCLPPEGEEAPSVSTVIRGAIDLVFKEADGWVVVDYKTDAAKGKALENLAKSYAPQVHLYARAWERCTGEKVKERGLYFTAPGAYVPL
ncbi:MAG: UvrD-helicase domain-containing protein [Planctomycetota bacterium]|jgi:ATP-dependent helicase/nuclease subunit A